MRVRNVLIAIAGIAAVLVVVWLRREGDGRRPAASPSDAPLGDARRERPLVAPAISDPADPAGPARSAVESVPAPVEAAGSKQAAGRSIQVRVLASGDERPVVGARVLAFEASDTVERTTDENGRCELRVPEGFECMPLAGEASGYLHACGCYTIQDEITLRLAPRTVLSGRLLAGDTGRPVGEARVHFGEGCDHREALEARSGPDGRFELDPVPVREPLDLWIEAEGFPDQPCRIELRTEGPRAEADVRLERGVEIAGRVIDFETLAGIPAARVSGLTSDATGAFRGPILLQEASERTGLVVEATGHCLLHAQLTREELALPLELVLPRGAVVEGTVRNAAGDPVAGAWVSIGDDFNARLAAKQTGVPREPSLLALPMGWRYDPEGYSTSAQTDSSGRFRIANAVPWRSFLIVGAMADGIGHASVPLERSGGPGEVRSVELVFEAPREAQVQLSFQLNGRPLDTASGRVRWQGPQRSGEESFSGDFYEVVELGEVAFELDLDGFPPSIEGARFTMQVEAGERNAHQVELRFPTRPINGRVTFEDGAPAPLASVRASVPRKGSGEAHWDELQFSTRSGDDGAYVLEVPDLGALFRVVATLDNDERELEGVRAGASGIDLVLTRAGTLLFRFRNASSGALLDAAYFELAWKRSSSAEFTPLYLGWPLAPDPEGWYEQRLPAGRLDLRANESYGEVGYRPVEVEGVLLEPQGSCRVEFAMQPGAVVELHLAPGTEPWPREQHVLLLEAEVWDEVRRSSGGNWEVGSLGRAFNRRFVNLDEKGTARIRGLAPGRFRFKVFPDEIVIEPQELVVGAGSSEPVLVRWQRR